MKSWDEIFTEAAKEMGMTKTVVKKIYMTFWRGVRDHIKGLPLKTDLTKEEFEQMKVSVNIPSIGKIYVPWETYEGMRKWYKLRTQNKELKTKEDDTRQED